MTIRAQVLQYLRAHPGSSAWQVTHGLKLDRNTVSSLMKRMVDDGSLTREAGGGPRGGYIYEVRE